MALIEGFRVQNYRALKDITIGKLWNQQNAPALTPLVAVIGKNGVGKSTLFDAFGSTTKRTETPAQSRTSFRSTATGRAGRLWPRSDSGNGVKDRAEVGLCRFLILKPEKGRPGRARRASKAKVKSQVEWQSN